MTRERQEPQVGALCQILGHGVRCYQQSDGVPLGIAISLASDAAGNLWVGGSSQIVRWQPGAQTVWNIRALQRSYGFEGVSALAVDRNNSVWAGMKYAEPGLGLQQFRGGTWKTFQSPQLDGAKIAVSKLFTDRDGGLWVGTVDRGIYRIFDGKVDHFDSADGLCGTLAQAIHSLPGTTFSNPKERGTYDSEAKAIFTPTEFNQWLIERIAAYHAEEHSQLGMSPLDRYRIGIFDGTDKHPAVGLQPRIQDPKDRTRLQLDFMHFEERTVQRYGIEIDKIFYYHDVLRRWINAPDHNSPKLKRLFRFRRFYAHLNSVWFYDPTWMTILRFLHGTQRSPT